jgi:hypothetical protein
MEISNGLFLTTVPPDKTEKTLAGIYEPYPPCHDPHYETCWECPKFDMDECKLGYNLSNYVIHNK